MRPRIPSTLRVDEACLVFACVIPETVQLVPVRDVERQEAFRNKAILHDDQMNVTCPSSPQRSRLLTLLSAVLSSLGERRFSRRFSTGFEAASGQPAAWLPGRIGRDSGQWHRAHALERAPPWCRKMGPMCCSERIRPALSELSRLKSCLPTKEAAGGRCGQLRIG